MKIMISIFLIACIVKSLSWVSIEDKVIIDHFHLAVVFPPDCFKEFSGRSF